MNKNSTYILILIIFLSAILGTFVGNIVATKSYNDRCMKYFGNKGYPASHYCKLFIGEVKARDEE